MGKIEYFLGEFYFDFTSDRDILLSDELSEQDVIFILKFIVLLGEKFGIAFPIQVVSDKGDAIQIFEDLRIYYVSVEEIKKQRNGEKTGTKGGKNILRKPGDNLVKDFVARLVDEYWAIKPKMVPKSSYDRLMGHTPYTHLPE